MKIVIDFKVLVEMKRPTKPTGEGYSHENSMQSSHLDLRSQGEASGTGTKQSAHTLQTTTKLTHMSSPIDIVKTTSGHYVSRAMIEQMRAQNQPHTSQTPVSAWQADPVTARNQRSAAPNQGYQSYGINETHNLVNYENSHYQDQSQLEYGNYAQPQSDHSHNQHPKQPKKEIDKRKLPKDDSYGSTMGGQDPYYENDIYAQGNVYPQDQSKEYPSKLKNQPKINKKQKKEKKDKDKRVVQYEGVGSDSQENYKDHAKRYVYPHQPHFNQDDHPFIADQPAEFYGPYGIEKNYQVIFQQQVDVPAKPLDNWQPAPSKTMAKTIVPASRFDDDRDNVHAAKPKPRYEEEREYTKTSKGGPLYEEKKEYGKTSKGAPRYEEERQYTNKQGTNAAYYDQENEYSKARKPASRFDEEKEYRETGYKKIESAPKSGVSKRLESKPQTKPLVKEVVHADLEYVEKQNLPKNTAPATGDSNFLGELSNVVKSIKKYEDNCKLLDQIYAKTGLSLRAHINYDYVAFSRNCLNIVRSLLNEVSLKDKSKDAGIRTKIDKLKKSIADRQGHIDFMMSLEGKPEVKANSIPLKQQDQVKPLDNIQISNILPPQLNNFTPNMNIPGTQNHMMAQMPMYSNMQASQMSGIDNPAHMQGEIIKKYLATGTYGSYITNPYLGNQSQASTQFEQSATGNLANQVQSMVDYYGNMDQGTAFDPLAAGNQNAPTLQQANFDENIIKHAMSDFENTNEIYNASDAAVNDAKLNFMPGLSFDPELYSGATGLFGNFNKNATAFNQTKVAADEDNREAFKNVFSLFTSKQHNFTDNQLANVNGDDSCSNDDLRLYSDEENNARNLDMPKSLERLLDDSIIDQMEVGSHKDEIQDNYQMSEDGEFEKAHSHDSPDSQRQALLDCQSYDQEFPPLNPSSSLRPADGQIQPNNIYNRHNGNRPLKSENAAVTTATAAQAYGQVQSGNIDDGHRSNAQSGLLDKHKNNYNVSYPADRLKDEAAGQQCQNAERDRSQVTYTQQPSKVGQNLDVQSVNERDLAVPQAANDVSTTNQQSNRKPQSAVDRYEDSNTSLHKPGNQDCRRQPFQVDSGPFDNQQEKERPYRSLLNPQQTHRLVELGIKASKAILAIAGKVIDTFIDSRPTKNEKKIEDHFFSKKDNPNNLTIYELCTTSEYSGIVQRKLSRLKESDRIELFYIMKPHFLRLTLDGLGKYVVHALISMSKIG